MVAGGTSGSAGGVGEAVGVDDSGGAIVDVSVGSGALEKTSEPDPVPPPPWHAEASVASAAITTMNLRTSGSERSRGPAEDTDPIPT